MSHPAIIMCKQLCNKMYTIRFSSGGSKKAVNIAYALWNTYGTELSCVLGTKMRTIIVIRTLLPHKDFSLTDISRLIEENDEDKIDHLIQNHLSAKER